MYRTDRASRVIEAPPAVVYDALLDRESLEAWLPPERVVERAVFESDDPSYAGTRHRSGGTRGRDRLLVGQPGLLHRGARLIQNGGDPQIRRAEVPAVHSSHDSNVSSCCPESGR